MPLVNATKYVRISLSARLFSAVGGEFRPHARAVGALGDCKTDPALRTFRRRFQEPFDVAENLLDVLAVLVLGAFDIFKFVRQVLVGGKVLPQSDEGSDDQNAHLYRALALEDRRQHRDAVLGEGVGWAADTHPCS